MNTKHRHYIAAPIVAFALLGVAFVSQKGLSVQAALLSNQATKVVTDTAAEPFVVGSLSGRAEQRTSISIQGSSAKLSKGSAVFSTTGFARIELPNRATILLLKAAAYATAGSESAIAALTGPIVVTLNAQTVLVPQGYQVRVTDAVSAPVPVPSVWEGEMLTGVPVLTETPTGTTADETMILASLSPRPAADTVTKAVSAARSLTGDASLSGLLALRLLEVSPVLDTATVRMALQEVSSLKAGLVVVSLVETVTNKTLPLTDDVFTHLKSLIDRSIADDALFVTGRILPLLEDLPGTFTAAEFPKQARLWQEVLLHTQGMLKVEDPSYEVSSSAMSVATVVDATAVAEVDNQQVIALAADQLLSKGAMFTAATEAHSLAFSASHIRISSVYFATKQGDQLFSLTYDTKTGIVSDIERAGELLPNALPLRAFIQSL